MLRIRNAGFQYSSIPIERVSFKTSYNLKQPKLELKLLSTLSETKSLFRSFCFNIKTSVADRHVFDADPDPELDLTFYFDANPNPDPTFYFEPIRIRIQEQEN